MPLENDLYATLSTTDAGSAVFPGVAPHATAPPFLIYNRVSSAPVTSFAGSSGLDQVRIQVDAYATTRTAARALAAQARTAMEAAAFKALMVSDYDFIDPETGFHRTSLDFRLWDHFVA